MLGLFLTTTQPTSQERVSGNSCTVFT